MRKNGFTLIELLAVMVVLAIIALIATPIIIEIVENAEDESEQRSVELYASAIKNAIATYQLTNANAPISFKDLTIEYDGDIKCSTEVLYLDGSFYLEGCKVNDSEKKYSYSTRKDSVCFLEDKDKDGKISLSDVVTCETESFYVMEYDGTNITMLSMYGLNVGDKAYTEGTLGIQNKNVFGRYDGYGGVSFSNTGYWGHYDENWNSILLPQYGSSYPAYIYDTNSNLYQYVNEYERILKEELKLNSAKASLMNLDQLETLGCSIDKSGDYVDFNCDKAPEWLNSTGYYWTGFASNNYAVCYVSRSIYCDSVSAEFESSDNYVRPVITISLDDLR